jgi:hypothetical protein
MARRAAKRDANEAEIVEALRALGYFVDQVPGDNGRPDLDVGIPGTGLWCKLEVKVPGTGRLTPLQKRYHATCVARVHVVESVRQAIDVVASYRIGGIHGQPGGFDGPTQSMGGAR